MDRPFLVGESRISDQTGTYTQGLLSNHRYWDRLWSGERFRPTRPGVEVRNTEHLSSVSFKGVPGVEL